MTTISARPAARLLLSILLVIAVLLVAGCDRRPSEAHVRQEILAAETAIFTGFEEFIASTDVVVLNTWKEDEIFVARARVTIVPQGDMEQLNRKLESVTPEQMISKGLQGATAMMGVMGLMLTGTATVEADYLFRKTDKGWMLFDVRR